MLKVAKNPQVGGPGRVQNGQKSQICRGLQRPKTTNNPKLGVPSMIRPNNPKLVAASLNFKSYKAPMPTFIRNPEPFFKEGFQCTDT